MNVPPPFSAVTAGSGSSPSIAIVLTANGGMDPLPLVAALNIPSHFHGRTRRKPRKTLQCVNASQPAKGSVAPATRPVCFFLMLHIAGARRRAHRPGGRCHFLLGRATQLLG